jgi:hypothetical protein
MQPEPMPLLIRPEPTHASDRSDMCDCDMLLIHPEPTHASDRSDMYKCDMCRYKSFYDQWTWHDMYHIIEQGLSNARVDTSADLVQKLDYICKNPLLNSVMTPDILSTIDIDNWFRHDFDKVGGYYREDPITKEQVRVPRRRVYFWDDEMTDYDALCQTIVIILSIIDDWVWEHHDGDIYIYTLLYDKGDGEKTMIAIINEIYDTIIEMYNTMIESEDEECDSVS